MRCVRVTIFAVDKQQVLHILSVCVCVRVRVRVCVCVASVIQHAECLRHVMSSVVWALQ